MTLESKYALVIWMFWLSICHPIRSSVSVIKAVVLRRGLYMLKSIMRNHSTNVPNFQKLVFPVTSHINAITFAANISYSFCMTDENSDWDVTWNCSSIPNFYHRVIRTWKEDIRMLAIGKAYWVNLIIMSALNPRTNFVLCQIVAHYFTVFWAANDFFTVSWELTGENTAATSLTLKSILLVSGSCEV